ncbi:helix-turn-helix domain-containing protein [Domibacillus sp. A3M-37]|uniref:helix-turn-helix domain-containing protein n=1 Tax=Domibacillus sp. A3M-37 TaxID=2962037 RepID=UPI0020B7C7BA|nr:helix-turn-helix transcriptional regulator [Domibacillus sp. A3M-37]MCP3764089.1 helix-turn-helix domain-containing protein [Domibacillus sp. A3M-37]
MKIEEAFGLVLRKYRKEAKITQEKLAFETKLDRTFISLLERGKRRPTLTTFFIIAKHLKVNPEVFIAEIHELQDEI